MVKEIPWKKIRKILINDVPQCFDDINYLTKQFKKIVPDAKPVKNAIISDLNAGLMDNSILKKLELFDDENHYIGNFFLKYTFAGRKTTSVSKPIKSSKLEHIKYEFEHMSFWKRIILPSPKALDCQSEKLGINPDDNEEIHKVFLLTQFWNNPTHDLDIIAINKALTILSKREEKDEELKKYFEDLKKDIVSSSLRTINEFNVYGTAQYKSYKREMKEQGKHFDVYIPKDLRKFYSKRLINYFKSIIGKKDSNDLQELINSISPALDYLSDKTRLLYAQGDEFLHHFIYSRIMYDKNHVELKSGMIDGCHSGLNIPELSKSKVLFSHLLDFSLDKRVNLFLESIEHAREIFGNLRYLNNTIKKNMDLNHEKNYEMNDEDVSKIFKWVGIYELIRMAGRAYGDVGQNFEVYNNIINRSDVLYRNEHIDFKSINVNFIDYNTYLFKNKINGVRKNLTDVIDSLVKESKNGEEKNKLDKLKSVLGKYDLI